MEGSRLLGKVISLLVLTSKVAAVCGYLTKLAGPLSEQPDNKIGDYQERFAEDLKSAVELHISSQPNLVQASKNGLPPEVLSELQGQMS